MACTASRYDVNCDGCRHCCSTHMLDPDSTGSLHYDRQAEADAKVWHRHTLRRSLIRNRQSN